MPMSRCDFIASWRCATSSRRASGASVACCGREGSLEGVCLPDMRVTFQ